MAFRSGKNYIKADTINTYNTIWFDKEIKKILVQIKKEIEKETKPLPNDLDNCFEIDI